jgi:hypothetical protein
MPVTRSRLTSLPFFAFLVHPSYLFIFLPSGLVECVKLLQKLGLNTCSGVIRDALYKESMLCLEKVGAKAESIYEQSQS